MIKMVLAHCLKIGEYTWQSENFLQFTFSTGCDVNKADLKISKRCDVGMIYKNNNEIIVDDENALYMLEQDIANHKDVRNNKCA